jgi:hypothetical protein
MMGISRLKAGYGGYNQIQNNSQPKGGFVSPNAFGTPDHSTKAVNFVI